MASIRHHVVATYIGAFLRQRPISSDTELAERVLRQRSKTKPTVPRRMRSRSTSTHDAGFEVHTLAPSGLPNGQKVVYLHGGSYLEGITKEHWHLIDAISRTGATVVVPLYPLAPEATWRSSRQALLDIATAPAHCAPVLMGDSAGGGLALSLSQELVDAGTPPAGMVLISPWVDLTLNLGFGDVRNDPWLDAGVLAAAGRLWAGPDDPASAPLSALNGRVSGLPATLLMVGTKDILYPSARELAKRLRAGETPVTEIVEQGLIHNYPLLPIPEAKQAVRTIQAFLSKIRQ